jgi:hypothetical protein
MTVGGVCSATRRMSARTALAIAVLLNAGCAIPHAYYRPYLEGSQPVEPSCLSGPSDTLRIDAAGTRFTISANRHRVRGRGVIQPAEVRAFGATPDEASPIRPMSILGRSDDDDYDMYEERVFRSDPPIVSWTVEPGETLVFELSEGDAKEFSVVFPPVLVGGEVAPGRTIRFTRKIGVTLVTLNC